MGMRNVRVFACERCSREEECSVNGAGERGIDQQPKGWITLVLVEPVLANPNEKGRKVMVCGTCARSFKGWLDLKNAAVRSQRNINDAVTSCHGGPDDDPGHRCGDKRFSTHGGIS